MSDHIRPTAAAVGALGDAPVGGPSLAQKKAFIATSVVLAALGLGAIVTATLLKGNASSIDRIRLGCYVGGGLFLGLVFVGGHVVACYTRPVAARANPLPRRRAEEERAAGTQRAETLDRSQRHAAAGQFSQNQKELRQTHQQHVARAEAVSPISAPIPIALQPALVATPLPAPQPPIAAQATTAQQLPVSRPKPAPTPAVVLGAEGSLSVENACALIRNLNERFAEPRCAALKAIIARVPEALQETLGENLAEAVVNKGDYFLILEPKTSASLRRGLLNNAKPWLGDHRPNQGEMSHLLEAGPLFSAIFRTSSSEEEARNLEILLHEKWKGTDAYRKAAVGYTNAEHVKNRKGQVADAPPAVIALLCRSFINAIDPVLGHQPADLIDILQHSFALSDGTAADLFHKADKLITDSARHAIKVRILSCGYDLTSAAKMECQINALLYLAAEDELVQVNEILAALPDKHAHALRIGMLTNLLLSVSERRVVDIMDEDEMACVISLVSQAKTVEQAAEMQAIFNEYKAPGKESNKTSAFRERVSKILMGTRE